MTTIAAQAQAPVMNLSLRPRSVQRLMSVDGPKGKP